MSGKALIFFASSRGNNKFIAQVIQSSLQKKFQRVEIKNISEGYSPCCFPHFCCPCVSTYKEIDDADLVVLHGPVMMFNTVSFLSTFLRKHRSILSHRPLALLLTHCDPNIDMKKHFESLEKEAGCGTALVTGDILIKWDKNNSVIKDMGDLEEKVHQKAEEFASEIITHFERISNISN